MSYSGNNIVKNSITLNEVTKATADALPNRDGKLLNVDGDLWKDDGTKLTKVSKGEAKPTRWGLISRETYTASEWVTTGTAAVADSAFDGSVENSFRVNLGTAGDTAEIEVPIPPAAIDTRYNITDIQYQLFDHDSTVKVEVLDWDDNVVGSRELSNTGSGTATADNLRFANVPVNWSLPFSHGSSLRNMKFRFSSTTDLTSGEFLINFIQSDSNPKTLGEFVASEGAVFRVKAGTSSNFTSMYFVNEIKANYGDLVDVINDATDGFSIIARKSCRLSAMFTADDSSGNVAFYLNPTDAQKNTSPYSVDSEVLLSVGKGSSSSPYPFQSCNFTGLNLAQDDEVFFYGTTSSDGLESLSFEASAQSRTLTVESDLLDEEKILSADVTALGDISDLSFVGELKVGARYLCVPNLFTSGTTNNAVVEYRSEAGGAGDVYNRQFNRDSAGTQQLMSGSPFLFIAKTTSLYLNKTDSSAVSISGNGTKSESWVQIIELPSVSSLVVPLHTTRADGQEYETNETIVVSGVEYRVFERFWQLSSNITSDTTLGTIQTGLIVLNGQKFAANSWKFDIGDFVVSASDNAYPRYESNTGEVLYRTTGRTIYADTPIRLRYYDTARPLY